MKRTLILTVLICAFLSLTGCSNKITNSLTFEQVLESAEEISYQEFLRLATNGEVDTVYYHTNNEYMVLTLFNEDTINMTREQRDNYDYTIFDFRKTQYPSGESFRSQMLSMGCNLVLIRDPSTVILTLVPPTLSMIVSLVILTVFIIMMTRTGGSIDDSLVTSSSIGFDDVIGHDELISELKFIVKLISDKSYGKEVGIKPPKGILLTGDPGTGKTMIAKAIAKESGIPIISVSGSDFKELYVGNGARRIRAIFKTARKHKPIIIFFDEIDSIGASRNSTRNNSEDTQTINALLKEMDGFKEDDGVFILAATNHPENLDAALTRSGRFDREIIIHPPKNWKVRKELFLHYLKDKKTSDDIDIDTIARATSGFTGADIATICNEAGIVALMNDKQIIDHAALEEAIERKIFKGNRVKEETNDKDREIVAYHEAGHAIMSLLCNLPISRASISANTSGVGGAVFREDKESVFTTKQDMIDQVKVAYAGRASEFIKFNSITTGAANDIEQATYVLKQMIDQYGFDEQDSGLINTRVLEVLENNDSTQRLRRLSTSIYNSTVDILKKNYMLVEKLATRLLEVNSMTGAEIKEYLKL